MNKDFSTGGYLSGSTQCPIHKQEYIFPIPKDPFVLYLTMVGVANDLKNYVLSKPITDDLINDEGFLLRKKMLEDLQNEYARSLEYYNGKVRFQ